MEKDPPGEGFALRLRRLPHPAVLVAALATALPGCTSSHWRSSADDEVEAILAGKTTGVARDRDATQVLPNSAPEGAGAASAAAEPREIDEPIPELLDLADALRLASRYNEEYRRREEGLYLSALALSGVQYRFSPRFTSTLSYLVGAATGADPADVARATLGVDHILPTGATLSASGTANGTLDRDADGNLIVASTARATLRQPLLRGAGYEASHEALTQAEREVVYSIRDFALFREQFVADTTRLFYGVLTARTVLANTQESRDAIEYQTRRARALFDQQPGTTRRPHERTSWTRATPSGWRWTSSRCSSGSR